MRPSRGGHSSAVVHLLRPDDRTTGLKCGHSLCILCARKRAQAEIGILPLSVCQICRAVFTVSDLRSCEAAMNDGARVDCRAGPTRVGTCEMQFDQKHVNLQGAESFEKSLTFLRASNTTSVASL
jgi:hypothetical protein